MSMNDIDLCKAVKHALEKQIELIVAEEAEASALRVSRRVREAAAQIAANVLTKFSMERFGKELVIKVDLEGLSR